MMSRSSAGQKWPRTCGCQLISRLGRTETYPEHNEAECQQVVYNEVAAHVGGAILVGLIAAPEEADVVELQDQDYDPVDACNSRIEAEGRRSMVVLTPNGVTGMVVLAVSRGSEGILWSFVNTGSTKVCVRKQKSR